MLKDRILAVQFSDIYLTSCKTNISISELCRNLIKAIFVYAATSLEDSGMNKPFFREEFILLVY
jgi:hypothetical protein